MKIAIMGTGGVGGYYGARLAAAGNDVHFIARGAHLAAIRSEGLKIESALGNLTVRPAKATDDPKAVGPAEIVMVAVKLWSTEEAVADAKPLVGPDTAVVSFQNGVDAVPTVSRILGKEHTLGGVAHIAAVIDRPGVIRHNGTMARLTFGELDGKASPRAKAFHEACLNAGIDAHLSEDIERAIWEKFVFLVGLSGMTTLTRLPIGPVREDPDTRAMFKNTMEEVVAVGRAKGIRFAADIVEKQLAFGDGLPKDMVSSMLGDLKRGNRLEVPWLSGAVARLGAEAGVATPVNRFIYTALKLHAAGGGAG
ncbi:MAG: 2-dehydropantoate 2-reductase [Betaproteobacteria bacterium]|nr:2-dehydropantoate 2-reductase [Betaproteobacteria bacterium]